MSEETAQTARAAGADPLELLAFVCDLLGEALPLALRQLQSGGVQAFDQWAFWGDVHRLEDYLSAVWPDYENLIQDYLGADREREVTFADLARAIRERQLPCADDPAE